MCDAVEFDFVTALQKNNFFYEMTFEWPRSIRYLKIKR